MSSHEPPESSYAAPEPTTDTPPPAPQGPWHTWRHRYLVTGACVGLLYGIVAFVAFGHLRALPTVAFTILVPLAISSLSYLFTDDAQLQNFEKLLLTPWLGAGAVLVAFVAVFGEGAICFAVLLGPFVGIALIATTVMWAVRATNLRIASRKKKAAGVGLLLLPWLVAPAELRWGMPTEQHEVEAAIEVHAPPEQVWTYLAEVDTIGPSEFHPGPFHWLGVPRPIRARVDRAASGGHRTGEFSEGLRFDEVITVFEPATRMAFSVDVDPARLRPDSAERHAFGQGYFRFVDATYRLEGLRPGWTRLRLSSRYVLTSGVNGYGRLWADAIVGDFQERVLAVLKGRAERGRAVHPPEPLAALGQ